MIYKTIGYNRWPRQWPEHVPLWQRWPNAAPMTAAWPVEMIGRNFGNASWKGHNFPFTVVMHFTNVDEQTTVYQVAPTIVRSGTATRIARTVLGERDAPEGIFTSIDYVGPDAVNWKPDTRMLNYHMPYRFNVNYQKATIVLDIIDAQTNAPVTEYRFATTSCGREIEIPGP